MAKLYFSYSTMNAGKSTLLLQASYNYRERGMRTLLFTSALYAEGGVGRITSRIGIAADADLYRDGDDLYDRIHEAMQESRSIACWSMRRSSSPPSRFGNSPASPTGCTSR